MTLRDKRPWSLLAGLAAVALIVGACQAAPSGTSGSAAPAAGTIDQNGTYTTNLGSEPDTIDPQKESFVGEIAVTMKVFEALMTPDLKTGKPIPAAAKDQPKVSSDGLSYTYTLRDDLKWSDGQPVTPDQFKYGWQRLCDPVTAGDYAFTGYIVAGCEKWNSMDVKKATPADLSAAKDAFLKNIETTKDTITFHLVHAAPYFNSIASIWVGVPARQDMVEKGGDKWTEPATFIGNGPFKLTDWKHNDSMVFERNTNFHSGKDQAKLAKWTYRMINDKAVDLAAYRNGEEDSYAVVAEDLRAIDSDADLQKQVVDGPGSCSFYAGFNVAKAPFTDKNVRLAFAKSFDRDAFVKDVQKIGKPSTSFISPGIPGYDAGDTFQKFDVAAAKDYLSKASPEAQAALKDLKFTYASRPTTKTRVEWIVQQWKTNLGIDIPLDPVDPKAYTALTKKAETTPQLFYLGWCADYYDQQDWLSTVFRSNSSVTHTNYKSAEFDKLVDAGDSEQDPTKRDADYQQASRLLSQDAPVAFVFYDAGKSLVKPWVRNYHISPLGFEEALFTDLGVVKH